jgi:3-deoxy-manno-octulosonate cytidylyltransferase (CMP-KDO synthetase)
MIIIPARISSTRFPKKVLYEINGYPMVILTAMRVKDIDDVVIATDSQEVLEVAKKYNIKAIITSKAHKSGTDRVNEAATLLRLDEKEIIINVQADEPFIEEEVVKGVYELTKKHKDSTEIMINSAYKIGPYPKKNDINSVKVVTNHIDFALYFSRSEIPYNQNANCKEIKIHLGIYGYTKKMLNKFCSLKPAPLEDIEKLEQLRALYHGYKIAMKKVNSKSIGIDTLEDLKKVEKLSN